MKLSNAQLLMLDNLIYSDFCGEGCSVGKIVNDISEHLDAGESVSTCSIGNDEWRTLVSLAAKDSDLCGYTAVSCKNGDDGLKAACFVDNAADPTDVNIVFCGTDKSGDAASADLCSTPRQCAAADYVENLPASFGTAMTASGHSKGGNSAQYATVLTDRIDSCVAFDSHGFSEEFIEKYAEEIEKKADRIVSVSSSEDFADGLLCPIAAEQVYIKTEEQEDLLSYHKPNVLLNENGELREKTERSELMCLIDENNAATASAMSEPDKSLAAETTVTMLEDREYRDEALRLLFDSGENTAFERITTLAAALAYPHFYTQELLDYDKDGTKTVSFDLASYVSKVEQRLKEYDKSFRYGTSFTMIRSKLIGLLRKSQGSGYVSSTADARIRVDTARLNSYARRLDNASKRLRKLNTRLEELYKKVGLKDLDKLLRDKAMIDECGSLSNCAKYLDETASDFNKTERTVSEMF